MSVGFIGMTLKATPTMVSPAGVKGLRFEDEAATANALVPQLRAQGADVIVVAIHEGGYTDAQVLELAASLKRENPTRTVAQVARILRTATGWAPQASAASRYMRKPCAL